MTDAEIPTISVGYDPVRLTGRLTLVGEPSSSIWSRLKARAVDDSDGRQLADNQLEMSWPTVLGLLREFGTKQQQHDFGFRFKFEIEAEPLAKQFANEVKQARLARTELAETISRDEMLRRLREAGFTRRNLRPFQERDLQRLVSLSNGANFSVPGSGKTTVTLALHLLVQRAGQHFIVIAPKSAFPAWMEVVGECIDSEVAGANSEQFTLLDRSSDENDQLLRSGATRFLMTYDLMVRQQPMLAAYLSRQPVHVVLDEAHRMKAGSDSQRGAFLLSTSALPIRRDILTGTPMPQGPQDLASQLGFLWPGHGYDTQIQRGTSPRKVLGNLYVRTTKNELGLPRARRHFIKVSMSPGQQALYGIVRNETLRKFAAIAKHKNAGIDFLGARRSVMRLLQLSANPILALKSITEDFAGVNSGVVDTVLDEGPSTKMRAVIDHARALAAKGKKVVIWTIFTATLLELENLLAELNPATLYGAVPSGLPTDPMTREAELKRFHEDPACMVMIANPAAAGEGISLHTVCHEAIYLDRSYVSTHYLQSIDRIHRLGLPPDVETNIYVYQTRAPAELGSVDLSVSRRLAKKIRGLEELLDDKDLHEIALDEESAEDPVDYSVDLQDLVDLVEELEGKHLSGDEERDD